jgi:hypothetical protein
MSCIRKSASRESIAIQENKEKTCGARSANDEQFQPEPIFSTGPSFLNVAQATFHGRTSEFSAKNELFNQHRAIEKASYNLRV